MHKVYLGNMLLPVTPSKIQVKIKNKNKTIDLINGEEINLLKPAGLSEFTFSFLLPMQEYDYAQYSDGYHPGNYYLDLLEEKKLNSVVFQFIITRKGCTAYNRKYHPEAVFKTNVAVTIEDYTVTEDADEGGDLTVSIKLKQYVDYGLKTVTPKKNKEGKTVEATQVTNRKTTKTIPKTYTVKSGDTLWMIAKKLLGDGSKCWNLAKLNGISNPNVLKVGQILKIQDVASSSGPSTTSKSTSTSKTTSTSNANSKFTNVVYNSPFVNLGIKGIRPEGLTGSSGYDTSGEDRKKWSLNKGLSNRVSYDTKYTSGISKSGHSHSGSGGHF